MNKNLKTNLILRWNSEFENVEVSHSTIIRINIVLICILTAFFIVILRLIDLTVVQDEDIDIKLEASHQLRGKIYDRNGNTLAISVMTKSLYVRPEEIRDIPSVAKILANIMNEYNPKFTRYDKLIEKITNGKNFVWIKRHILPSQQVKIQSLGIPGIYFTNDSKRLYSYENDFAHTVGFVDIDQNGISGIEKTFNDELFNGKNIYLSLDARVQSIVRHNLNQTIAEHEALGGMAVIMNVKNGEIISMVSLPDFNPNGKKVESKNSFEALFNRTSLGVYEMGSTFKILTVAIGLDLGVIKLHDTFNVAEPIKIGKYSIGDYKFHKAILTLPEVLIFSSNRGVSQVGTKIGIAKQQEYMQKIGMLAPVSLEISERGNPICVSKKNWNNVYLTTISYGHGIAVTALHTSQAIAAVVNGGILYSPTLLKTNIQPIGTRVFKEKTSFLMRKIMRTIVEEGYAKKAEVHGYNIGGKTGTAEKVKNGRYVKKNCNIAYFAGAFPIYDPQYVIFVAIDEPKPNKSNGGFTTGGMVAAPLASNILKSCGYLLMYDINNNVN